MILVDSSVWIDYFRGDSTAHTRQLDEWLEQPVHEVVVADLVLYEVLRGFRQDHAFQVAHDFLLDLPSVEIGGMDNALLAAARAAGQQPWTFDDELPETLTLRPWLLLLFPELTADSQTAAGAASGFTVTGVAALIALYRRCRTYSLQPVLIRRRNSL